MESSVTASGTACMHRGEVGDLHVHQRGDEGDGGDEIADGSASARCVWRIRGSSAQNALRRRR